MPHDAVTYTQHMQQLQKQVRLDWQHGEPRSDYARENIADLLEQAPTPEMARQLARAVSMHAPTNSSLELAATSWWLKNLGQPSTAPTEQLRELLIGYEELKARPLAVTEVLAATRSFFHHDLSSVKDSAPIPLTLALLKGEDVPVPIYAQALDTFTRLLPLTFAQAPATIAASCAELSAELGSTELQKIASEQLGELSSGSLKTLSKLALAYPGTEVLQQGIVREYRARLLADAYLNPAEAWENLLHQRRELPSAILPVREVFTELARQQPAQAASEAALELADLPDSAQRHARLADYQQIAASLAAEPAVQFLAELHGRVAFEADLLRPSRAGLLAQFGRLGQQERQLLLEPLCSSARGDSLLRNAICNAFGENKLS